MANFGRRERRRQATFRAESSAISAVGRSPSDDKARRNGHLLALGSEHENLYPPLRGQAGAFRFLADRGINWWSSSRSGDRPGGTHPTRNLASSQIACINFLLPLASVPQALAAVLATIDHDDIAVTEITDPRSGTSSPVEFEWIGLDHSLEGPSHATRGANTTSVDAFIIAETGTGRCAYLIEWKYVEEYRRKYLGDGNAGDTRRRRYSARYAASPSFKDGIPLDWWLYDPFYQIMRLRLLADRMVERSELGVSDAKVVVVVPSDNRPYRERITSPDLAAAFPSARTVAQVVRAAMVRPEEAFVCVSPDALADTVRERCGPLVADWSEYHRDRYGW